MKNNRLALILLLAPVAACSGPVVQESDVVRQYATNLFENYYDVVISSRALEIAIHAFVQSPTPANLTAAREAWLAAHAIYGQAEASRFYSGPIDELQGVINEWPLDENLIDYTYGNPGAGIINHVKEYPEITWEALRPSSEQAGSENLTTGFHAIEFLLGGQRLGDNRGPGARPATDYVDGGTAEHPDRRRTYLALVVDILTNDVAVVKNEWQLGERDSYGAKMVAGPPHDAVTKILRGFSGLAILELGYERLSDPYLTQDRKDEESCFSESTFFDLRANAQGVENVYLGRYGTLHGPSISDLVQAKSPEADAAMRRQIQALKDAIEAIPQPFDESVRADPSTEANKKVKAAIDTIKPFREAFREVAAQLDVKVNF